MASPVSLPTPAPSAESLYTRDFWTASASHFLLGMGFWMFVVFPLHLADLGASTVRIGVLLALEPTAAVLVRPVLGAVLSRRGGRRWTLRGGGVLNLFAVTLYAFVDDLGVGMAAVRILHGVGIGALFTTFFTYAADIAPIERRTEGLAVFGISGILPTAFAPALAEELVLRGGFDAMFAVVIVFSIASLAISWRLVEPAGEAAPSESHGFWRLARERRRFGVWATALAFSLAMSSYVAFLEPFAHERGFKRAGLFFLCYSLAAVVLRAFGRSLPDRLGPRRMLVPALASLGIGLYLVARLDSTATLGAAGLLCGMGHGYLFPILSGLAIEGTDRHARGSAMSFFTAVFDLGQMLGPPIFGVIAEAAGYPAMFLTAMAGVAAAFFAWIPKSLEGTQT